MYSLSLSCCVYGIRIFIFVIPDRIYYGRHAQSSVIWRAGTGIVHMKAQACLPIRDLGKSSTGFVLNVGKHSCVMVEQDCNGGVSFLSK